MAMVRLTTVRDAATFDLQNFRKQETSRASVKQLVSLRYVPAAHLTGVARGSCCGENNRLGARHLQNKAQVQAGESRELCDWD